jgi:hypothetical protein
VARPTYYFEVYEDYTHEFPKGVISIPYRHEYMTKIRRCMSYSHKVWLQGSRGGVKIIKDREDNNFGYVTKNEELMKEFMWAKLKAQSLAHYI